MPTPLPELLALVPTLNAPDVPIVYAAEGDLIVVLEAMKMEQPLTAHRDGTIAKVDAKVGTTVSAGHQLLAIED